MPPKPPTITPPPSVEGLPPQLTITTTELQSTLDNLNSTEQAKLIIEYRESIKLLSDKDKIRFYDNGGIAFINTFINTFINILATTAKALQKKGTNTPTPLEHQSNIITLNPHIILSERGSTPTLAGIYHWGTFKDNILPLAINTDKQIQIPNTPKLITLKSDTTGTNILTNILNIKDLNNLTQEEESKLWTIDELAYFINNQSTIQDKNTKTPLNQSPLPTDGYYNIFPFRDNAGNITLVSAVWLSGLRGWVLLASVPAPVFGGRVVFRN